MWIPESDTIVYYPSGSTIHTGVILWAGSLEIEDEAVFGFFTDGTSFHPESPYWPDQPSDVGRVSSEAWNIGVRGCRVVAAQIGRSFLPMPIPNRRSTEGVALLVLHEVDAADLPRVLTAVGQRVSLVADGNRRERLSAAHSASHLAALALNEVCAALWRKAAPLDVRGYPDFDQQFIARAKIGLGGSSDVYRLGKSARKAGFAIEEFEERAREIAAGVSGKVNGWISDGGPAKVEPGVSPLSGRRLWTSEIEGKSISIPCGGTHQGRLSAIGNISVEIERLAGDAPEFRMTTTVAAPVVGR